MKKALKTIILLSVLMASISLLAYIQPKSYEFNEVKIKLLNERELIQGSDSLAKLLLFNSCFFLNNIYINLAIDTIEVPLDCINYRNEVLQAYFKGYSELRMSSHACDYRYFGFLKVESNDLSVFSLTYLPNLHQIQTSLALNYTEDLQLNRSLIVEWLVFVFLLILIFKLTIKHHYASEEKNKVNLESMLILILILLIIFFFVISFNHSFLLLFIVTSICFFIFVRLCHRLAKDETNEEENKI